MITSVNNTGNSMMSSISNSLGMNKKNNKGMMSFAEAV
jgi:hypothetical protein